MEVEVKFRLDSLNYTKALSLFKDKMNFISTDKQQNYFFDSERELDQKRINFRIRVINDLKAIITLKGKGDRGGKLQNGISRISELETELDFDLANAVIKNPMELLNLQHIPLIKVFIDELQTRNIVISEQFANTRMIFDYDGLKVEVDQTEYVFGKAYEIEIESENPEEAKALVGQLMTDNGIEYSFSKRSKYGNLKAGSVL